MTCYFNDYKKEIDPGETDSELNGISTLRDKTDLVHKPEPRIFFMDLTTLISQQQYKEEEPSPG
ncbi:hypothetical protein [Maribellus sp. YY47]|uniref:hypothetical protein n=1 Tax=Maribellus sp. YY47 TaxID=2929486 RepID=UPI002000FCA5|nr:hypothetical protein [Maribellus sp. YY47]MCK3683264.1 hypothetical protein [Maribellus sp. YY47]